VPSPSAARRPVQPWQVAALSALLLALFVVLRVAATGGDPSVFVHAGDRYVDAATAPAELTVRRDSVGYDGQFVYRLALDPFTNRQTDHGISFDTAEYRQQRIGLPLLAFAVDRATPLSTLWSILLVNVTALIVAAYAAAHLVGRLGRSPLWALLLAFAPGLVVGLSRGLTEPLAWACLLAALAWWWDRRYVAAAAALTAGVLTRETVAVAVAALGVVVLVEQIRARTWLPGARWPAYLAVAVPTLAYAGWQAWLRARWGAVPASTSTVNLGIPVLGPLSTLFTTMVNASDARPGAVGRAMWSLERGWLLAIMGWATLSWRRSQLPGSARAIWLGLTVAAVSLGGWAYDIQFLRATNEGAALSMLVAASRRGRGSTVALAGSAVMVAAVAGWFVVHP
jgi:hypothetical protein